MTAQDRAVTTARTDPVTGVEHREPPPPQGVATPTRLQGWRRWVRVLGPGLVTGAADDDPSGIATYAQAGASYRYQMLWAVFLTLPLMAAVQEIADRTALATGEGLGALAAQRFRRVGRWITGVALVAMMVANTINIAADLAAAGAGMQLLHLGSAAVWSFVAGLIVCGLVVMGSWELVARVFKYLTAALLVYLVVAVLSHPAWGQVLRGLLVPTVRADRAYLSLLVAVLGTTISGYLFFWQNAHRVEELRDEPAGGDDAVPLPDRPRRVARRKQQDARADVFLGMVFSNLVGVAIIIATGANIGAHGSKQLQSAADAARALEPVAGSLSTALFALGFIGTALLAIPVLAGSTSAGLAGLTGRAWGFSQRPGQARLFYALVGVGTLTGTVMTLLHVDLFGLLVLVAVLDGLTCVPFLVMLMLISDDRELMRGFHNGRLARTLGWTTVVVFAGAVVSLLVMR